MSDVPRVGVGVLVVRDGLLLLGERRGAHGAGSWALPGGHLEFGETVEQCARRELDEETGLQAIDVMPGPWTSDVFTADITIERRHYVTLFVLARCAPGEALLREPAKCAGWRWCSAAALPSPLFPPLQTLLDSGYRPAGWR